MGRVPFPIVAYKFRTYPCADCGRETRRKRRSYDPKVCIDCGVTRLTVNSLMMRMHAGRGYARWLESAGPMGRPRKQQEG